MKSISNKHPPSDCHFVATSMCKPQTENQTKSVIFTPTAPKHISYGMVDFIKNESI